MARYVASQRRGLRTTGNAELVLPGGSNGRIEAKTVLDNLHRVLRFQFE